jgi:hypothetical protein
MAAVGIGCTMMYLAESLTDLKQFEVRDEWCKRLKMG